MKIECPNCGAPAEKGATHSCGVFVNEAGEAVYPPPPPTPTPTQDEPNAEPKEGGEPKPDEEPKPKPADKPRPQLRGVGLWRRRD